jgi:hypothetical protein
MESCMMMKSSSERESSQHITGRQRPVTLEAGVNCTMTFGTETYSQISTVGETAEMFLARGGFLTAGLILGTWESASPGLTFGLSLANTPPSHLTLPRPF